MNLSLPWPNVRFMHKIHAMVVKGGRPEIRKDVAAPLGFVDLMESCWHQDPLKRPTFRETLHTITEIREKHYVKSSRRHLRSKYSALSDNGPDVKVTEKKSRRNSSVESNVSGVSTELFPV